jgi:hypothetical protein
MTRILEDSPCCAAGCKNPPNLLEEIPQHARLAHPLAGRLLSPLRYWRSAYKTCVLEIASPSAVTIAKLPNIPKCGQYGRRCALSGPHLGSRFNLAPQLGYRALEQKNRSLSGVSYGAFAVLALAPGAADLTGSYSWVAPQEPEEGQATLAEITAAYAISPSFRLSARYSLRNSTLDREFSFGVGLEWIP